MNIDEVIKELEIKVELVKWLIAMSDKYNFGQPRWKKEVERNTQLLEWLKELKELRAGKEN